MRFSLEVFPPRTADGLGDLSDTVVQLERARPAVRVRHLRRRRVGSAPLVRRHPHRRRHGRSGRRSPHVRGAVDRATSTRCVDRYAALGVEHVVALRGDPPDGAGAAYAPHPDGYRRTADLVAAVKARAAFDVAVSAYPERHPQSPSIAHDLDVLAEKVDAGADRAITQMFFDNELFLRHRDRVAAPRARHRARARRVPDPLVPCRGPVRRPVRRNDPEHRRGALRRARRRPRRHARVAAELAAEQIAELADHGVEHVHLYTLNRAELALAVGERLGAVDRVGS